MKGLENIPGNLFKRILCCFLDPGRKILLLMLLKLCHITSKAGDGPWTSLQSFLPMEHCQK